MAIKHLRDPDLRRLRALMMIDRRVRGRTISQIAEEFNLSDNTVKRTLNWARKAELVVQAEDKILRELVPAAQKAITEVFAGTNDEVKAKTALEIFKGTLPSFSKRAPNASTASPESDLASYVNQLRTGQLSDGDIIDAEPQLRLPEGGALRQIPASAESIAPQGLSGPAEGDGRAADAEGDEADS